MKARSLVPLFLVSTLVIILISTAAQGTGHHEVTLINHGNIAKERFLGEDQETESKEMIMVNYGPVQKVTIAARNGIPYGNSEYREVKVEEILKQIENGEDINLVNCHIIGELNVSKIKLETTPNPYYDKLMNEGYDKTEFIVPGLCGNLGIIKSNITIVNCTLENKTDFSMIQFKNSVDFTNTNFNDSANFLGANFNGPAMFSCTTFNGPADFSGTNFIDTDFYYSARFDDVSFNSFAEFPGTKFNGYANFAGSNFNDYANFQWTIFNDGADFQWTRFNSSTYFLWTIFNEIANFDTEFNGYTDFSRASFNRAYFKAKFSNPVDFKGPDTSENIFTDGKTCETFRKFYIDESKYTDADNIYYNYRVYSQQRKGLVSLSKWMDIISWIICGYGLKPSRTLLMGAIIVGFFSIIYWKGSGIYRSSGKAGKKSTVSCLDALLFSIREFTTVGSGEWYPRGNFRILVTLEGLLGWVMLGIFMATLTNVMIRS